jgi:hypothetical protein
MPLPMIITPELIPPAEFHTGSWLLGVERPTWYYFLKREKGWVPNRISNEHFIQSVDEPLRDLVGFLHMRNIRTTPSCSGHHLGERDLEAIHAALVIDGAAIRADGLELADVETGLHYWYHDARYQLPWDAQTFVERTLDYEQQGVLGLCLEDHPRVKSQLLRLRLEGVRIAERDGIIFLFTKETTEQGVRGVWRCITAAVTKAFGRDHPVAPLRVRRTGAGSAGA